MIVIGCDFHPSFQQIAMLDTECGTTTEHKLMHTSGEAERFYRGSDVTRARGHQETVGNDQWFVQLHAEAWHSEVWVEMRGPDSAPSYVRSSRRDGSARCRDTFWKLLIEVDAFRAHMGSSTIADAGIIASCWCTVTSWCRYVRESQERATAPYAESRYAEEAEALEHRRQSCSADPSARSPGQIVEGTIFFICSAF